MTVDGNSVMISLDYGRNWPDRRSICDGSGSDKPGPGIPSGSGQSFKTAEGVLVWRDGRVLHWDNERGEVKEGSRGGVWSIRSVDGGATWSGLVIIAREKGAWLSYAYLFEHEPGLFWIFTGQGRVQVQRPREGPGLVETIVFLRILLVFGTEFPLGNQAGAP